MRDRFTPLLQKSFLIVGLFCLAVFIIVIGKPVLAPIALSVLVTFILTPVVTFAESYRLPRWLSVTMAVGAVAVVFVGLSFALVGQLHQLAIEIPTHTKEIEAKIESVRGSSGEYFQQVWATIDQTTKSFSAAEESIGENDKYVVVQESKTPWVFSVIPAVVLPALEPLTTFTLVLVLSVFMLFKREDLRNRFLALLGRTRLSGTTKLLSDASHRLSRYLLGLLAVNFGFAVAFTFAIYMLGIPYAAVWGTVTFFFRFVPLLGSSISMCLPLLVSIAIVPGWFAPIGVILVYLALEGITGNIIEPLLFGQSVGMNPFAILVALMFWTWAWGPLGLMLATPLSLVVVTLGRHLPCFSPLNLLFGDNRPLRPSTVLFQRLLASDLKESRAVLDRALEQYGIEYAIQFVAVGAIVHSRREHRIGNISQKDEQYVLDQSILFAEELLHDYCLTVEEAKRVTKENETKASQSAKKTDSLASTASQAISSLAQVAVATTSNAIATIESARESAALQAQSEDDDNLDWQRPTEHQLPVPVHPAIQDAESYSPKSTHDEYHSSSGTDDGVATQKASEGRSTARTQEYQDLASMTRTKKPSGDKPETQMILGYSIGGPDADICLRTLQQTAGLLSLEIFSENTEHFLRQVRKREPSVVIVSASSPSQRNELETVCRILRRRGYQGWILVGYWRTKPIAVTSKKAIKDAGADYVTHDLRRLKRMLIRSSDPFEFEMPQFGPELSARDTKNLGSLRLIAARRSQNSRYQMPFQLFNAFGVKICTMLC